MSTFDDFMIDEAVQKNQELTRLRKVNGELVRALELISTIGGNVSDSVLEERTGANDAVSRGIMITGVRRVAREALKNSKEAI